jgi:hypothetical protein
LRRESETSQYYNKNDEFRIDPFDNDIPYDWARPPHKGAELIEFVEFMEFIEFVELE